MSEDKKLTTQSRCDVIALYLALNSLLLVGSIEEDPYFLTVDTASICSEKLKVPGSIYRLMIYDRVCVVNMEICFFLLTQVRHLGTTAHTITFLSTGHIVSYSCEAFLDTGNVSSIFKKNSEAKASKFQKLFRKCILITTYQIRYVTVSDTCVHYMM